MLFAFALSSAASGSPLPYQSSGTIYSTYPINGYPIGNYSNSLSCLGNTILFACITTVPVSTYNCTSKVSYGYCSGVLSPSTGCYQGGCNDSQTGGNSSNASGSFVIDNYFLTHGFDYYVTFTNEVSSSPYTGTRSLTIYIWQESGNYVCGTYPFNL